MEYSVQHTDRDARERAFGVISRLIFWPIIQFMYTDAPKQLIGIFMRACIQVCVAANGLLDLEDT